jgi:membrane-associated phospholipid phosphatase
VTPRLRAAALAGWWPDGLLLAGFVAITVALAGGAFGRLDLAVRDWCEGHRPAALYWAARVGNWLAQGTPLTVTCLLLALLLAWRWHSIRPVLPVLVAFALTFGTLTPLKDLTSRPAPHATYLTHPERFGLGGQSYPSGHVTNAIVWYGVLALLLAAWLPAAWRRALRVAPPAIVCLTTVYLGYHWVTDTVAGLLLGLLLDRIMRRIPWDDLPLGRRLAATGWDRPAWER